MQSTAGPSDPGDPIVIQRMSRAVRLARRGLYSTDPNPRVGCVIVDATGAVVGEGWHERAGGPHAEIHALNQAGSKAKGATAYVSLEPCCHHGRTPPCSQALIDAGVNKVVVAMLDPNPQVAGQGIAQLEQRGITVQQGVLESEARALNPGFIQRMIKARPWIRVKTAMSLDGRTAMASGESQWITGSAARADVHRLRARSSAILTGIGTVLQDDPSLTARLDSDDELIQPIRVILDSELRLPLMSKVTNADGQVVIYTAATDSQKKQQYIDRGIDVVTVAKRSYNNLDNPGLDLQQIVENLASAYQVNELLVEAGATLNGCFLEAGLVDELWLYVAPSLLGSTARPAFRLPLKLMSEKFSLGHVQYRQFGHDLRICAMLENQK